ncbi:Hypothetical predicted protein [Mytilus galloprovincialis]|uniref:Cysteine and tyrosine-rich protein 1 n=2 Tax=Mytilus galloprovincialis TaxID=29158 RepID=A0A8B6DUB0_MYTGA|nr:Hypothetical predicted protein [Mytilus galloprovincialis]
MAPHTSWNFMIFCFVFKVCEAFEFCTEHSSLSNTVDYMYCEYSCCGYIYNRYCCENFSGVIAGAVIGSIVFLGVIIGVILCVVKKKGHRGTVIAPAAGGTHITQHSVAFVTATQIQPPTYSQLPPAYGVAPGYQATYSYPPTPMFAPLGTYPPPPAYPQDVAYPPTAPPCAPQPSSKT